MFHFADLTARNATEASSYLVYANAFDPPIDDGWRIVPVGGQDEPEANLVPTSTLEDSGLGNAGF
jgi:hypothetical protein